MNRTYRIGQIVPSSNTTMETEIPAMLRVEGNHQAGAFHVSLESHAYEARRERRVSFNGCGVRPLRA